ncbi:hypothetical protein ACUXI4_002335 [Pantoea piersonii]|jgi:hypothetical protein
MKIRYFQKAQELSREAHLFGDSAKWAMAMLLLRRAHQ